eukprot:10545995-Heterocapsa_arctica.AAC.1
MCAAPKYILDSVDVIFILRSHFGSSDPPVTFFPAGLLCHSGEWTISHRSRRLLRPRPLRP